MGGREQLSRLRTQERDRGGSERTSAVTGRWRAEVDRAAKTFSGGGPQHGRPEATPVPLASASVGPERPLSTTRDPRAHAAAASCSLPVFLRQDRRSGAAVPSLCGPRDRRPVSASRPRVRGGERLQIPAGIHSPSAHLLLCGPGLNRPRRIPGLARGLGTLL